MATETATVTTEQFHRWMHDHHMYGLWELASQMTARPMPEMRAWMWQWSLLESIVKQSGEVIPVGEERRALQLFNPGLGGQWATTPTLIAAVQLLLPGEVARAHRHTPTAIRFILEGSGAYTAVEGERVYMEPGDLVLTPNWQWHDHGNETDHPVVWLDGLDIPLVRALSAMFFELHPERQAPVTKPRNASQALYGYGRLSPTWVKERPQASPLLIYSWDQALAALQALRDCEGSPYEGIILEYTHPQTGGPCLPTMGCYVQLLRPGEHLQARRTTGSAVFCVVQGQGYTVIDGEQFVWSQGDIIALPSWALCEHANTGAEEAVLFSMRDQPVMEALGLYREEVLVENRGHQDVVRVFRADRRWA